MHWQRYDGEEEEIPYAGLGGQGSSLHSLMSHLVQTPVLVHMHGVTTVTTDSMGNIAQPLHTRYTNCSDDQSSDSSSYSLTRSEYVVLVETIVCYVVGMAQRGFQDHAGTKPASLLLQKAASSAHVNTTHPTSPKHSFAQAQVVIHLSYCCLLLPLTCLDYHYCHDPIE